MPTVSPAPRVAPSAAAQAAGRNWRSNLAALSTHQPDLAAALATSKPTVTWAVARDGSLSARGADGQWVAGCSVPVLAGRALLRSLAVEPGGHCLLAPAHVGLVIAARERLGPDPVLFVVQPDLATCAWTLACADLTADLAAARLWFAAGDDWAGQFHRHFDNHPGLSPPARFIQTRLTPPAVVEPLILQAQRVIGAVAAVRGADLDRRLRHPAPARPGRTTVIAGSRFRLWTPGGDLLSDAVGATPGCQAVAYDTDDPLAAAPTSLATAVDGATTIVALDLGRASAAAVLPAGIRWITWVTQAAVPPWAGAEPQDHLVVADPTWGVLARHAGWPANRVHVGTCPPLLPPTPPPSPPAIGLIADTCPVELPKAVQDYSSQRLLWDAVAAEIEADPLAVGDDAAAYVVAHAKQWDVAATEFDVRLFINALVLPLYAQGLGRLLIAAGLPVRLWGRGWDDLAEFRPHAAGPVRDFATLQRAVAASTGLVRPTPGRDWHPVTSCGRPVLSAAGRTAAGYLSHAATLLRPLPRRDASVGPATMAAALGAILRP